MDLAEIRSFVSAAHRLSCTQAARELDISQSTITRHIQHIEAELGYRLIERERRLITLTRAGDRFLLWAEGVLERYQRMRHDLKQRSFGLSRGTIAVASSIAPYEFIVPRLVHSFLAVHHEASVETAVRPSADVFVCLLEGKSGIGFAGTKPDHRFSHEVIALDEIVLAVPHDHSLASRPEVDLRELGAFTFLTRELGSGTRNSYEDALRRARMKQPRFKSSTVMDSTESLVTAVQDGYGVGLVSLLAIQARAPMGIRTVRFRNLKTTVSFYMVHSRKYKPDALTNDFVEWVRENRSVAAGSLAELKRAKKKPPSNALEGFVHRRGAVATDKPKPGQ